MDFKKGIAYGLAVWILMFVVISIFVGFKIYDSTIMKIVGAIVGGIIVFVASGFIKPQSMGIALCYGITFVVVGLVLDLLITARFDSAVFVAWTIWLGYALVLLVPLTRVKKMVKK